MINNGSKEKNTDAFHPKERIGYTEFRTDLPGGRWVNFATRRSVVVRADGQDRRFVGQSLVDAPNVYTHFAGWSPDGLKAVVARGWNDPQNGQWEEEHRELRMEEGKCLLDCCLVDMAGDDVVNLTAVERVSHYNSGLFFFPDGKRIGFTALIDGVSVPHVMDIDGRNKRDVSGGSEGFIYGYHASPDGRRISYHENYQIYVADADGTNKRHIETGNPFNFDPKWSPDGQWLLFLSGVHGRSDPWIVRSDGSMAHKLADCGGYQGWVLFLDVYDFHQGSSDCPAWSSDGRYVYFTAQTDIETTQIMQADMDGQVRQLTRSPSGTLNYQPIPSPDGRRLCFGSNRSGIRQLYITDPDGTDAWPVSNVSPGWGALWPYWNPLLITDTNA